MKSFYCVVLGLCLSALLCINSVSSADPLQIVAGGSSYDAQLFQSTMFAYNLLHPETSFSYISSGSGAGRANTGGNTPGAVPYYHFGGSDSPLGASDFSTSGADMFVLPALAAAIVPIYNLPGTAGLTPDYALRLNTTVLTRIFMADIKFWDDPAIVADNPKLYNAGLLPPNTRIHVITRFDKSGTSRMFTEALEKFYTPFQFSGIIPGNVATGSETPVWENQFTAANQNSNLYLTRANLNSGVADAVLATPYSIGYSVLAQALERQILYATLQNSQQQWVTASVDSVTYAMYELAVLQGANSAFLPSATNLIPISIANPSAKPAWPLAGLSYAVFKGNSTIAVLSECSRRAAVVEFMLWFYTSSTAADIARLTGYNQLPLLLYQALDMENILKSRVLCNNGNGLTPAFNTLPAATTAASNKGGSSGTSIVNPYFTLSANSLPTKDSNTNYNFVTTSSQAVFNDITSPNRKYDFGVVIQSELDPAALPAGSGTYTVLPYMIAPVLPVYTYKYNTSAITLNFDILGKIFTGEINAWNDPAIQALNPAVSFNGQNIIVVIPQRTTTLLEVTPVLVNALFKYSAAFRACYTSTGNNANFKFRDAAGPTCGPNSANLHYQEVLYENYIQSTVANIDGSLGVTYTPYGIEASIFKLVSPHDSTVINTFNNPAKTSGGATVTDPTSTAALGNCLTDTLTITADLKTYTFEAAQSSNPLCWPLTATISIILPGQIAGIDMTTKQSVLDYVTYLFNEPSGVFYSRGLDLGYYVLSSSAQLLNPTRGSVVRVQGSAQRILTILTGQPTLFVGDSISQSNSGQYAVLSFVFATVGAWTTLILVEQVVYDTKQRRDSVAYYASLAAAAATFSIVAEFASLWVSMAEITLSAPIDVDLNLVYNPATMILSFLPGFVLSFFAFFIMTKAIKSTKKTASASTNQSGGTGTTGMTSKNSTGNSSTDKSGLTDTETADKADAPAAPKPAALDLDSLVSVFSAIITKYSIHSFVCTILLLCAEIILIVMSRAAISSHLDIKYDSGLIAAAVIVFFILCSLGVQCMFWLVRFRFVGAFILGFACFAANEIILAAQTNTWKGENDSIPSDYWSKTTVTLIASIVAAAACFLLLGLQFSRMKLSRNELDLIVAKLSKQLKKAEKDILLGKAKVAKQKALTNYLHGITQLISYIRPNTLNSVSAGMLVSSSAFEPQVLTTMTKSDAKPAVEKEQKGDEEGHEASVAGEDDEVDPTAQFEQAEMSANARLKYFQQIFTALTQDLATSNETLHQSLKEITLQDILNNPVCLELFKDAVGKELSSEHISFYLACKQFSSKQFTPENNLRKLLGAEIMKAFIEPKAKYTVNISSRTRQALISSYKTAGATAFNSTFFAPAQKEIYNLLAQDSFERFVKTPQFVIAGMIINSAKVKGFQTIFNEGKAGEVFVDSVSLDVGGSSQREASRTKGSKIGKSVLSKLPTRVIKTQVEEETGPEKVAVELQQVDNTAATTTASVAESPAESKAEEAKAE